MSRKKIVVIGAGSASFGISTLAGIMRNKDLQGSELCLVDIDQQGLEGIAKLANRMNTEWGSNMQIRASQQRTEMLPGADFVVLSIAVDRENRWKIDYELAKEYGIMHYAENGGPAALFHTARNLAQIMPIVADMQRLCPNAYLLNFTNPVPRIVRAIRRYSSIKAIGICHQLSFGYMMAGYVLARDLGIDAPPDYRFVWTDDSSKTERKIYEQAMQKIDILAAGINHFTWMLDVRTKAGDDIYELLKRRFLEAPADFEPLTQEMIRIFDYVPVPGDCHLCEYLPYTHDMHRNTWSKYNIQMYDLDRGANNRERMWNDIAKMGEGVVSIDELKLAHTERAELIMGAMATNSHAYEAAINLPNEGCISNLPDDAIVEVPAVVDADGVHGLCVGELPEPVAEMCRRQISIVDLAVEAGVKGDRKAAIEALALDPMIDDPSLARVLFSRYLEAHKDFLPQFA